jgi:hypothetical protein
VNVYWQKKGVRDKPRTMKKEACNKKGFPARPGNPFYC